MLCLPLVNVMRSGLCAEVALPNLAMAYLAGTEQDEPLLAIRPVRVVSQHCWRVVLPSPTWFLSWEQIWGQVNECSACMVFLQRPCCHVWGRPLHLLGPGGCLENCKENKSSVF